jgi:diguanylate cyclase (GGDEF)-like protein
VNRFKSRISDLARRGQDIGLQEVCREAEDILGPTMVLATDLAKAYDQIRRQSHGLLSFVEVRTDQLTGICNRKSLDDSLEQLVALHNRYDLRFSLAMFDIDYFKKINDEQGHVAGDQILRNVAQTIDGTARDTDVVTRYGGEEFVVLMPQTELTGACVFAERVRQLIQRKLKVTVSGGVAIVSQAETSQALLERVDAALYQAKTGGRNRVFVHVGHGVEPIESILDPVADESAITAEQQA